MKKLPSKMSLFAVWMKVLKDPSAPKIAKWLPIVAMVYVVSPLDFIPDILPVLGLGDDLIMAATAIAVLIAQRSSQSRVLVAEQNR